MVSASECPLGYFAHKFVSANLDLRGLLKTEFSSLFLLLCMSFAGALRGGPYSHLPPWRREQASVALQRSQRQRAWLWSRDYYPTRLLELQGVQGRYLATHEQRLQLAWFFWWEGSAVLFLESEEIRLENTCRASWVVRGAFLAAAEDEVNTVRVRSVCTEEEGETDEEEDAYLRDLPLP